MRKSTFKITTTLMFLLMGTFLMAQFNVTFNVDMTDAEGFDPAMHEVYLSGDFAGWAQPGTDPAYMFTTADDILYTLTVPVDSGWIAFKYFYIETGTPNWDLGEWTGDPNRSTLIMGETTLDNVWGNMPYMVTFNVDMTEADPFDPATDAVYIAGSLAQGWAQPGTIPENMLIPDAANEIYSIGLLLYPGDYMYKFFLVTEGVPSWDGGEWEGDPNREVTVDTVMTVDKTWGLLSGIGNQYVEATFSMYPNPTENILNVENLEGANLIEVYNVVGARVLTIDNITTETVQISTSKLNTGVYFLSVHSQSGVQTAKFLKN